MKTSSLRAENRTAIDAVTICIQPSPVGGSNSPNLCLPAAKNLHSSDGSARDFGK